jgi:hypothetical protein
VCRLTEVFSEKPGGKLDTIKTCAIIPLLHRNVKQKRWNRAILAEIIVNYFE